MENVIIVNDGFERNIRKLKKVIDLLEETDEERKEYAYVVDVLRNRIWEEFDMMCGRKAKYSWTEYRDMLEENRNRREAEMTAKENGKKEG